jgi:DNA-binding NarL/FixJ family response regulator
MNRESKHRDIYHDMMPFKVKEILLVANLYDAFFIEREGRFSEIMLYDYGNMNLSSFPRITGVSTKEEVFEQLEEKNIDMVIVMIGLNTMKPLSISKKIKQIFPEMPVFVLLNNNLNIAFFQRYQKRNVFDQLFVWNGESRIFFAMIKYLEDLKNAKNDTSIAAVRQILIVEDSPAFYSSFLTHLYRIIYKQTNEIINDVSTDNLYKVLKLRARPKIILASNYEDAMALYNEYKEYIFCLITDVQYEKNGVMNKNAGFELIDEITKENPDLPTIVLSQDKTKGEIAKEKGISFIDKNAQNLYKDLKHTVTQKIGFGAFIFKDMEEKEIARAHTIKEFEELLQTVPDESIHFHGERDHFSLWLMARTEIQLAKVLVRKKAREFKNANEIREYLLTAIKSYRDEQPSGKVVPFDERACRTEENIVTLVDGSYGGKGRGLAFVHSLKDKFVFERAVEGVKIRIPKTAVIGTDEFESFLERNDFVHFKENPPKYEEVKSLFLKASLSDQLIERLKVLLNCYLNPIAIRSSGTFEDSFSQPFAGIFETYILPNNHLDETVRLQQTMDAIKLVFASVFSETAINYTLALDQKLGEENMAIVIQELVGNNFNGYYYPHISGVAQSYNFYPFAHMKPEEGFVTAAVGLGIYVVEGEAAFRFSPKYPKTQFLSLEDQVKYTQTYFYAVDMHKEDLNLSDGSMSSMKKVDIYDARDHGSLTHCVSVYDNNNRAIYPGLKRYGPIVVNFASILNHEYVALSKTIEIILNLIKDAFGSPVEIEFAVDLNRDADGDVSFYILQVKPIIRAKETYSFNFNKIPVKDTILHAGKGMGNGIIDTISDIVFIKNDVFDRIRTEEMAEEIEVINKKLGHEGKEYILIGPGRWGTRDRFIGIPVNWPQISNAKVIVETGLEGFPLDASYGSHFFHNLTTLNIAYFSVSHKHENDFINYDILNDQELIEETTFFKHVRFSAPITVKIDGRKRMAVVHR